MIKDKIEYIRSGDIGILMECSLERGVIIGEQYLDYLQIEKDCAEYDDDEFS